MKPKLLFMKVLILGGDGYLGWPTAMHFSSRGDTVMVVDNFAKRRWELEEGIEPLIPVNTLHRRVRRWKEVTDSPKRVSSSCRVFTHFVRSWFCHRRVCFSAF